MVAASELFLSQGYNKTAMSQVADSLGVANAAVYWYFPSKDHLLAAVWTRVFDEEIAGLESGPEDPFGRLMHGLANLAPYRNLHMTVHERMLDSPDVTVAHDRTLAWIRETATAGIAWHGREHEPDLVELVVLLTEGANVPGTDTQAATDLISNALNRFRLAV